MISKPQEDPLLKTHPKGKPSLPIKSGIPTSSHNEAPSIQQSHTNKLHNWKSDHHIKGKMLESDGGATRETTIKPINNTKNSLCPEGEEKPIVKEKVPQKI